LRGSLSALSTQEKKNIFGTNKNRWYSAEIIYAENPNVVNYDCNALTLHSWPVKTVSADRVVVIEAPAAVTALVKNVEKMQKSVSQTSWRVSGPIVLKLKRLSDGSCLRESIEGINSAMLRAGVTNANTLGDYLRSMLQENASDLMLSPKLTEMVVSRCMSDPFSPTLNDIKKLTEKEQYVAVKQFVDNCPALFKEHLRPIKHSINKLAIEMLESLQSSLVSDGEREVARIKHAVREKIDEVTALGDEQTTKLLNEHLDNLQSIDKINSPIEGVVFVYKGCVYKFTGSFSAVNQILGLIRY